MDHVGWNPVGFLLCPHDIYFFVSGWFDATTEPTVSCYRRILGFSGCVIVDHVGGDL
jgi:hypothetical protein